MSSTTTTTTTTTSRPEGQLPFDLFPNGAMIVSYKYRVKTIQKILYLRFQHRVTTGEGYDNVRLMEKVVGTPTHDCIFFDSTAIAGQFNIRLPGAGYAWTDESCTENACRKVLKDEIKNGNGTNFTFLDPQTINVKTV